MKKFYISFLLLAFSLPLFSQNAMITVISPNGGENWIIGCPYAIQWITATQMPVKIELYKNGAFCLTISNQVPAGMNTYTWIPPYTLVTANTYKVKVSGLTNAAGYDFSNANFTISQGTFIIVTSPNGGEAWARGTTHIITWQDNIPQNVRIELWKGGVFNSVISAMTPSNGFCYWAIPATLSAGIDYKVKILAISSTSNSILYDFSDNNFSILASNIFHNIQKSDLVASSGTGIKVYPNPCTDLLHVELGEGSGFPGSIELVNVMGKTLLHQDIQENSSSVIDIATTQLTEGFYILLIRKENEIFFKNALIIRH